MIQSRACFHGIRTAEVAISGMEYKGYVGIIEYDSEAQTFHGHVATSRDVVTFEGRSVKELRSALKESVDDYIAFCAERGEEPERPFSGRFVVRLDPGLHQELSVAAARSRKSLNAFVTETLRARVTAPRGATTNARVPRAKQARGR